MHPSEEFKETVPNPIIDDSAMLFDNINNNSFL